MKYWKSQFDKDNPIISLLYMEKETKPEPDPYGYGFGTDFLWVEITKEEYDLHELYGVRTYDNDPTTGHPWASEIAKQNWIKLQLWEEGVRKQADKGQEVENAIELNDAIKYFLTKLIRTQNFNLFSNLQEIALDNTDISKQTTFNNNVKTWKAYGRMLDSVEEFERSLAIATNTDPTHSINWVGEKDFINMLTLISQQDRPRWIDITKLFKVEESYEPSALVEEYKKLQQAIHSHIQPIDPNIVNGKDTLSHELGGTTK